MTEKNMFGGLSNQKDSNKVRKVGEEAQRSATGGRRRVIRKRRDAQLAVRIYPEKFELFVTLADKLGSTYAETMEAAIEALARELQVKQNQ